MLRRFSEVQIGGYVTALYIGLLICVVAVRHDDFLGLKLNELGDFMAGAFGPVAFGWLVLGYIQQGKELKVSSAALVKQGEELALSVKQQILMQEHAEIQVKIAQEKLSSELSELELSLRPIAKVRFVSSGQGFNREWHNFEVFISNSGAYDLKVHAGDGYQNLHLEAGYMAHLSRETFQASFDSGEMISSYPIRVSCLNARGAPYFYRFVFEVRDGFKGEVIEAPLGSA